MYYKVNPEIDEKTYKKEKVNILMAKLSGYKDIINDIISDLEKKRTMLKELENDICCSIEEKSEIKQNVDFEKNYFLLFLK